MTTTFLFFGSAAARASGDPRKVLPIARPAASRKKSRRVREINPEPSCNGVMADCLQRDSQERRLFLKSQTAVSRRAACPNRPSAALEASGKPPTAVAPRPACLHGRALARRDNEHQPGQNLARAPADTAELH